MYIFGGEFTSPSQNQFYHYKDFWRFNIDNNQWEQLKDLKGGPTPRSGHMYIIIIIYYFLFHYNNNYNNNNCLIEWHAGKIN